MVLAALGLGLAALSPVAWLRGDEAKEVTGDLKRMQGTWVADDKDTRWTFEGRTLKASVNGTDYVCKVTLDPKAGPRTVDFLVSEGPEESAGKTALAIYKIDDDRLTICVGLPGNDRRPVEFKEIESEAYMYELKRAK
jgi:uncharacterized protein (TIGR03067 family)